MITERQLKVYRRELTPVDFLERSGLAHAGRVAVVDGGVSYIYAEWRDRSCLPGYRGRVGASSRPTAPVGHRG